MDSQTIVIFIVSWVVATGLVILGCKLFSHYCWHPGSERCGISHSTSTTCINRGTNAQPEIVIDMVGQRRAGVARPLFRMRSRSMPEIAELRVPTSHHNHSASPPMYDLVISHPSLYQKRKRKAEREETLPPPPHYDDLEMRTIEGASSAPDIPIAVADQDSL